MSTVNPEYNSQGIHYENIIVDQIIDETNEKGNPFKKVIDMAGQTHKFQYGKEGRVKNKWPLLKYGAALRLTIGTWNGFPVIEDLESLTDLSEIEATRKRQQAMRDIKNESIEAQVAVKAIVDQQCNGVETPTDLIAAKDNWLRYALRNYTSKELAQDDK